MLGKLIKYEWKNTYKAGCLILLSLVATTFLGWLAFQSPMWRNNISYTDAQMPVAILMNVMSVFTLLFYVIMLIAAGLGIVIYLTLQFYRTMYSGEGYLTHTLPVTKNQLLISKILIGGVWSLLVTLGIILSVAALVSFMVMSALAGEYSVAEFWRLFLEEIGKMFKFFEMELDFELSARIGLWMIGLVSSHFITLTVVFGAISLGQLFAKHRVLMAIVCYIGVQMMSGLLESVTRVMTATVFDTVSSFGSYVDTNSIVSWAVKILLTAGMYLASWLVTSKKLNLE